MKPWHAVLICVGILLFASCGGLLYFGGHTYSGLMNSRDEEARFADQAIPAILTNWDPSELEKRAAPELTKSTPPEIIRAYFTMFKTKLGKFEGAQPSKCSVYLHRGTDGTYQIGQAKAEASFYRDNGTVILLLINRDGNWRIVRFAIDAKILDATDAPQNANPQLSARSSG